MGKMFYTAEEAAAKLGKSEAELKDLVRSGKLREFRDAGTFNYRVEDVDKLAPAETPASDDALGGAGSDRGLDLGGSGGLGGSDAGLAGSGDIVLEPADDSSIEFSPSGSDVVSFDTEAGDSGASGSTAAPREKEGTVIQSVGTSVFDDDELDEQVDPLAQTAITDVAGLGMEGTGSGSGILELSRESDDTSLGTELLQEITGTPDGEGEATVEMGSDAGPALDATVPEETTEPDDGLEPTPAAEAKTVETAGAAAPARVAVRQVVEYGPDAVSAGLTALLAVAIVVMWFAGLGAAALSREIAPGLLQAIYSNLMIYTGGALVAGIVAAAVTYLVAKKRSG
jgi:hypothetical protein